MFWIALELSIPKIGLNIMLSLTVKKLDAFKFDRVAESDNTVNRRQTDTPQMINGGAKHRAFTIVAKQGEAANG